MTKSNLNGSVDLLAQAMRAVFQESMETVQEKTSEDMKAMEKRIDKRFDTVNNNMQSQFAVQQKDIGKLLKKAEITE